MAARKFNSAQEQKICLLYVEKRLSTFALAKKFNCSAGTIINILKRNNAKRRSAGEAKRVLSPEDENEVCRMYIEERLSSTVLAKKFNCSAGAIRNILHRKEIKLRKFSESNKVLSPEDEKEVSRLYGDGINPKQISEIYGCSAATIRLTLKRNKVKTRTAGESRRRFSPEIEQEICKEYQEGSGSVILGKKYNCHQTMILKILERNNVQSRERAKWTNITPEEEKEICRVYLEKKTNSLRYLTKKFDRDVSSIKRILKRNNIRIKSSGEWRQKELEEEQKICQLYQEGLNMYELAEKFDCSTHCIQNILQRYKIQTRDRSEAQWKYSAEEQKEICILYKKGLDIYSISEKIGGKPTTIHRILQRHGIQFRTNADYLRILSSKNEEEKICKLYEDGLSMTQIAEKFNCSIAVISRILKENEIKIRSFSETSRLENNPRWLGGISFEPYCPKFNNEFKERVRNNFGRVCMICGKTEQENGKRLSVHHVNYEKMACCDDTPPLFLPLCHPCHVKTNHNREYWERVLTEFIMIWFNGDSYLHIN